MSVATSARNGEIRVPVTTLFTKLRQNTRQGNQDEAEHDCERDQDQEHQDVGAEHPPRVAAHGTHAVAERLEHP